MNQPRLKSRWSAIGASSGPVRSSHRRWPGGRPRPSGTKRGDAPPSKLGTEPADHHMAGVWLGTELCGDLGHGAILEEEPAQRLIPTVEGQLGLQEETTAELTIPEVGSHQLTVFCPPAGRELTQNNDPGKATSEAPKRRFAGESQGLSASAETGPSGFERAGLRANHTKNN